MVARLWACARRDLLGLAGYIDGVEARLSERALLLLSGGPTADFNMALIDSSPDDESILEEFALRAMERRLPCLFMISGTCAPRLGSRGKELGLFEAGTSPLMSLEPDQALGGATGFAVERVTERRGVEVVGDLVASAFELDREWVGRTFCTPSALDAPSVSFFVAARDGQAYSAVTTTASGSTVGIWSMATPANRQRVGAGRAALIGAIEHHQKLGATTFYLIATPAGKPLYDAVGFITVDEAHLWVAGQSEQL
jgi:hypothetical protein